MIINHNIAALNTSRQLNSATNAQSKSMEKLSSGLRINSAADDAAGLAISEKMRGQIRGLDQASRNSQDAISLIQTAEGALSETTDILQRMKELATQAATDTNTVSDRGEIQKEIDSLTSEINRIGNTTEFNTQKLLNGAKDTDSTATVGEYKVTIGTADVEIDGKTFTYNATGGGTTNFKDAAELAQLIEADTDLKDKYAATGTGTALTLKQETGKESATAPVTSGTGVSQVVTTAGKEVGAGLQFQIGANENQSLTLEISDMRANALGLTAKAGDAGFTAANTVTDGTDSKVAEAALDVSSATSAASAITVIQNAIDTVSSERSKLGANQNRLEHTINNLGTSSENLTAAESRIRDVDMASEMMEQTKNSILSQAAQAMLAQANQLPQGVLQLLR